MPGQPIKEKLFADVEAAGGWDVVFERIASGETIAKIAKSFGVSRGFFSTQMSKDPERRAKKVEAQQHAAAALADEALEIADNANILTREALDKDKNRSHLRMALAGFYDREQFGQKPQQAVTINIGQVHLDTLRARVVKELPKPVSELPVLPAELMSPDTPALPTEDVEVPNA